MQVGFPRFDYGSNVLVILASVCPIRVMTSKFPWYTGSRVGPCLKDRRQIPKQTKKGTPKNRKTGPLNKTPV